LQDNYYVSQLAVLDAVKRRVSFNFICLATSFKIDVFVRQDRAFDRSVLDRAETETVLHREVLCHADNFRAPQAARLHPLKPYFCFAPCVDGTFTIDRDHPFTGRYRYLITDAKPDAGWLDRQWESWCGK